MASITEKRYTPKQLMEYLDVSRTTLQRWACEETAPQRVALVPMRIGGRLYYTDDQLKQWQERIDRRIERKRGDARRKKLRLRRAAG